MKASQACIDLIHHFEGCHLDSYVIAGENAATIGWGHQIPLAQHPKKITQAQADAFFADDLGTREMRLASLLPTEKLTQGQIDATLSFMFNAIPSQFALSTFLRLLKAGDFKNAGPQLLRWTHGGAGNKEMPGLVRRRKCEKMLFDGTSIDELKAKHFLI
jgi:GH24 family phage-related lysozyme (muramidase)